MRGEIDVETEMGDGSRFTVQLPRIEQEQSVSEYTSEVGKNNVEGVK
jgi:hypothetical protein